MKWFWAQVDGEMIKWKMGAICENMIAATYSTFEEESRTTRVKVNDEDIMADTEDFWKLMAEYDVIKKVGT